KSSRRQHITQLESLFLLPLATLRKYVGPFALHTCHQQMQHSLFHTEVVQLPPQVQKWASYQIPFSACMMNSFDAYVSTCWLLQLIMGCGLVIEHLLQIVHTVTEKSHHLALLQDKQYICDCCMGLNLGLSCHHYFRAWTDVKGLPFHIGLI
ncbi:hypothetical protein L208DRAFT_1281685, partial [Tricholoma matsutake]